MYQGQGSSEVKLGGKCKICICWVSFEKLMSNYNQTWVKDVIGVPSYVNEVKGHVPRSRII